MCRQWRSQHLGSTRAFDYALYCRTLACMLCMFVLPPTSLIKVVNSGSFHWALSVFIYFRFMLAFRVQFAGDVNQEFRSQQRLSRIRSLALYSGSSIGARIALCNWVFFQFNSYQIECFFEAMGLHRTLDLNPNPMDIREFSRIISNER